MKSFKGFCLCLTVAFGMMHSPVMANDAIDQKEMQWQQASYQVDDWIQEGKIDPEMKNIAIALNLLGISIAEARYGSSVAEENLEGVPYIKLSLDYPDMMALVLKLGELEGEVNKYEDMFKDVDLSDFPEMNDWAKREMENIVSQEEQVVREIFRLANRYLYGLHQLLEAFYKQKDFEYDAGLVLDELALRNHGGQFQILRTLEEQKERQAAYRQEMEEFAYFVMSHLDELKNEYK